MLDGFITRKSINESRIGTRLDSAFDIILVIMAMGNPWRGCKKCRDGCLHCYIHRVV